MTTILNENYFVNMSTQGGGGQNYPKFCFRGLYTPLVFLDIIDIIPLIILEIIMYVLSYCITCVT